MLTRLCYISLVFFFVWSGRLFAPEVVAEQIAPPADGELRVVTWNLQFLGRRNPPRTDEQLQLVAQRIRGWNAAVIALQEIQSNERIRQLVAMLGPTWKVNPEAGWNPGKSQEDETCLLWDTSKVTCLTHQAHLEGYPYSNRPPFSGVFQPEPEGDPFVVIANHAYPGGSAIADKHRMRQGAFYRRLISTMLQEDDHPTDILLVGDFNGAPGSSPHTAIQPAGDAVLLHLLPKTDDKGTLAGGRRSYDIDHIYVTLPLLRTRLRNDASVVIRPTDYGETPAQFKKTYSDHLPVYVDIAIRRRGAQD